MRLRRREHPVCLHHERHVDVVCRHKSLKEPQQRGEHLARGGARAALARADDRHRQHVLRAPAARRQPARMQVVVRGAQELRGCLKEPRELWRFVSAVTPAVGRREAAIQVAEPDHLPASSSATLEADHAPRGCERLTRWRLAAFGWSAREPLRVVGVARRQQQGIGRKFTQIAVHDEHLRATKRSVRLDCKRGEECVCLVRRHARGRG